MKDTIAGAWLREGIAIGDAQGMEKGMEKGIAKGRAALRSAILKQGRKRIGDPTESQAAALDAINDIDRLGVLAGVVSEAASWDDLLRMA